MPIAESPAVHHSALSIPAGLRIEPTGGGAYAHAWRVLKANFWRLLLIGFVAWFLGSVVGGFLGGGDGRSIVPLLYQYLIGTPIIYGAAYVWLRAVSGDEPVVGDLFVPFRRNWLKCVAAQILLTIVVLIGFLLFVVPGVFLAVRLAFAPLLVVDEGRGPVDALLESWNRTAGSGRAILFTALLAVAIFLLGLVQIVVGSVLLPASMLVYLAYASLYAAITARKALADSAALVTT